MIRAITLLALTLCACAPDFGAARVHDDGEAEACAITLIGKQSPADAALVRAWCHVPAVVIERSAPCPMATVWPIVDQWLEAGALMSVRVDACPPDGTEGTICLRAAELPAKPDGVTPLGRTLSYTHGREVAAATITVNPSCDDDVIRHEIGHALGFEHADARESVMYRQAAGASIVSPGEAAQLRATYGGGT